MPMEQRVEQELLPGIPNDITLEHVTTKIGYETIDVLSKVNHTWNQAIQDRFIHNARVRRHSTETFNVFYCDPPFLDLRPRASDKREIVLFHAPWAKQFVAVLDGKVYSLGGWQSDTIQTRDHRNRTDYRTLGFGDASAEVYVLDLAGCSKNWERCAPLQAARLNFWCGVKDGKIHVIGGWNGHSFVNTAEVYDPKNNSWSNMPIPRNWRHGLEFQPSVNV